MPDGRMLSKSIATSEQVASVSLLADYLFTRMIPHLDSEGRMAGSPKAVRGMVCPLREDVSTPQVEAALDELQAIGLIVWYSVDGQRYIAFPKFRDHQRGARFDREGPSRIPAPSEPTATLLPEHSRSSPVVLPLSEVKRSEVKTVPSDDGTTRKKKPARHEYSPDFEDAWSAYPRRDGTNSKSEAGRQWDARVAEGKSVDAMKAGTRRYKAWCDAKGKTGTETVMQGSRFYGRDAHWEQDWEIGAPPLPFASGGRANAPPRRMLADDEIVTCVDSSLRTDGSFTSFRRSAKTGLPS